MVTELFADPDFDGDPIRVKELEEEDEFESPEDENDEGEEDFHLICDKRSLLYRRYRISNFFNINQEKNYW